MNRQLSLCMVFLSVVLLPHIVQGYKQLNSESRWPTPSGADPLDPIVVEYYINENGDPGCTNGDEFIAVQKGFQAWSDISTSKIMFEYQTTTPRMPNWDKEDCDNYNVVGWIQSGWDNLGEGVIPYAVAQSRIFSTHQGGSIRETDLFINGEDYNWSADPDYNCPDNRFDVQNMTAHEAGHWCGLGDLIPGIDPLVFEQTMKQGFWVGQLEKRSLESDDIAGASFLYPYKVYWPNDLTAIYKDLYHHFDCDVALSWNPTGKDEYLHGACLEGLYTSASGKSIPLLDSFSPLDSIIWPVRVVYGHNDLVGWSLKENLSDYHNVIFGPQLEIDENDNQHIIWAENDYTIGEVVYRKRENGFWGMEYTLSDGVVDWPRYPTIAVKHAPSQVSPHSDMVYAAWVEKVNSRYVLKFRRSTNGGSNWDYSIYSVAQSDIGGWIANPKLAIDSTGGVHLVWEEEDKYGYRYLCWVKNTNLGSSAYWTDKVSKPQSIAGAPSVAIDGYGYVHIAYSVPESSEEFRIFYDRISRLGGTSYTWDSLGPISPNYARAENPHVVCDNLGFVHFFWDDNRHHRPSLKKDIFHARNIHMGDGQSVYWYPGYGAMIYQYPASELVWLGDASKPDTFGDIFVGIDVYRQTGSNWDIYTTLGREDDRVRELPWPPGQMASASSMFVEEENSPDIKPQGCYLSATLNRLSYFAPAESQLSCYSVDGRRVWEKKIKGAGHLELDFLPSGTYFAHLKSTDGSSSRTRVVVIN